MHLEIKTLHPQATIPAYAHTTDAGLDLCAVGDSVIHPQQRALIDTGLALAIPIGYVGLVWDKSGIATKAGVTTLAGVIDAGYRGEVKVALYNTSNSPYTIQAGQKIAQLLIQPITQVDIKVVTELDQTQRGEGGFGSTGL